MATVTSLAATTPAPSPPSLLPATTVASAEGHGTNDHATILLDKWGAELAAEKPTHNDDDDKK